MNNIIQNLYIKTRIYQGCGPGLIVVKFYE